MGRKGKKKGRKKRKEETALTAVKDVVTKAMKSKTVMRLWQDTVLHEELMDLKRRLEKAHGERDSLQKRIGEREDQQEAVFDALKERVIVAQAEIQTLMAKTEVNDERRRREHDDTQRVLEERIDGIDSQRLTLSSLQAQLREKNTAFDSLTSELRTVATENEELLRKQARLKDDEETLEAFRRKLAVLTIVDDSEQAVADGGRREEGHGAGVGNNNLRVATRRVLHAPDIPGLGLVPLLMEGMSQLPKDAQLARDALALLGYVTSTEPLGRTFLTTHKLYRQVMAALQRHVTDNVVALHAARLLHKSALQGEATTRELRAGGVITLLAEALASACYGPNGARKPRRLLYHSFATIRLCYPSGFFGESLQTLRLQRNNKSNSEIQKNNGKDFNTAMATPTAPATTGVADRNILDLPGRATTKKECVSAGGGGDESGVTAAGKMRHLRHPLCTPVRGAAELLGLRYVSPRVPGGHSSNVGGYSRAQRPHPLPSLTTEDLRPNGDGQEHLHLGRQGGTNHPRHLPQESSPPSWHADGCRIGRHTEEGNGSGYWDSLRGSGKTCGRGGADACMSEQSELAESAVASAVLLRWAVEGFVGNGVRKCCGDSDDLPGTGSLRAGAVAGRSPSRVPEKGVSGTKSSPVRSIRPVGESRGSPICSVSHVDRPRAGDQHEGGSSKEGTDDPCAAAIPLPLEDSSVQSLDEPRTQHLTCRGLRASGKGRREVGATAGWDDDWTQPLEGNRCLLDGGIASCSLTLGEAAANAIGSDEGGGRGNSRVVNGPITAAGQPADVVKSSERWLDPAPQDVAFHALVCLLRAAEVDLCGDSDKDRAEPGGTQLYVDPAGGVRAVVREEGVLLLVLQACNTFQDRGDLVKACCMLMRRPDGGPLTPGMVLLIENGMEDIVTRAAKAHMNDPSVATEASALFRCLGMHRRTIHTPPATVRPLPPPLSLPPSPTSVPVVAPGCVTIDAVTKTTALDLSTAPTQQPADPRRHSHVSTGTKV